MEQKWDQLAAEGTAVLVVGLRSADWERVRDGFAEWFDRRGQDECVFALLGMGGPAEISSKEHPLWRARLSEGLTEAWDQNGADELSSLIEELAPPPPSPPSSPPSLPPGSASPTVVRTPSPGPAASVPVPAPASLPAPAPAPEPDPDPAPAPAPDSDASGDHFSFNGITVNGDFIGVQNVPPGDAPGAAARSVSADWPLAQDMQPQAYGVRPTRRVKDLPQLPPYVVRDADPKVNSAVQSAASEGGLVVVRGEPFAGKSRTALAAMAEVFSGVRVFAPAQQENLRGLPALLRGLGGERCAVWLDDLDGHLDDGGLEPRLLAQLTGQGVAVVATMREDAFDEYKQTPRGRVFDVAHIVDVPRDWSHEERKRAGEADDPRLTEAARRCGVVGVAAYLAVGPMLWDEWRRARRADQHPRGHALVRAAIDLARCGLRGPLSQDLLVKVHEGYEVVAGMDRESVDDALAWAGEKRHGVLRMLRRKGASEWEASPCLVDTASQEESFPAVDGAVWGVALEVARADSAYDSNVVVAGARRAFRAAAEAGDVRAMHGLGLLEESLGDEGEAEMWFRRAVDAGRVEAARRLGRLLVERGNRREAELFLEQAAEAGDGLAALLLGELLRDRSERWLRVASEETDALTALRERLRREGKFGTGVDWREAYGDASTSDDGQ